MRLSLLAPLAALAASQFIVAQTASAQTPDPNVQPASAAVAAPQPQAAPAAPATTWKYIPLGDATLGWLAAGHPGSKEGTVRSLRFVHPNTPQVFERKKVSWMYDEFEIDCTRNTFQVLRGYLLDKDVEDVGRARNAMDPEPIADRSPEFILKKIFCDHIATDSAKSAENRDAAIFAVGGVMPPKH